MRGFLSCSAGRFKRTALRRVSDRGEIILDEAPVDAGEREKVGEGHAFVDLMHRRIYEAELDHWTVPEDEARVRRAAVGRQLRAPAGYRLHGTAHGIDERPRLRQKHIAYAEEAEREFGAHLLGSALALLAHPCL